MSIDESVDVLNLRLLQEEKEEINTITINLKNKSTIVNLYASGNVGNIELYYSGNLDIYHDYYILSGFNTSMDIINGISAVDGFSISFNIASDLLIRINPKIVKFKDYDSYLYNVSLYTQNEV